MTFYFIKSWLLISILSIIISHYLLSDLLYIEKEDNNFFLTIISGLTFFYSLRFVFILSILSLSIFLNQYESIRKNSFYSLLTYCLIPFGTFFCFMIGDLLEKGTEFSTLLTGWKFLFTMIAPHFIISLICYFHFRKRLKNQAIKLTQK